MESTKPAFLGFLLEQFSTLQPYREYASRCNYCRRKHNKGRVAYGVESDRLTVMDYETLLERGFVRSGGHVYLPSNTVSCCPNVPIRLDVTKFKPGKQHIKTLRNFKSHITGAKPIWMPSQPSDTFSQLLALAQAGKAHQAAEIVCKYAKEDVDSDSEEEDEGADVEIAAAPRVDWQASVKLQDIVSLHEGLVSAAALSTPLLSDSVPEAGGGQAMLEYAWRCAVFIALATSLMRLDGTKVSTEARSTMVQRLSCSRYRRRLQHGCGTDEQPYCCVSNIGFLVGRSGAGPAAQQLLASVYAGADAVLKDRFGGTKCEFKVDEHGNVLCMGDMPGTLDVEELMTMRSSLLHGLPPSCLPQLREHKPVNCLTAKSRRDRAVLRNMYETQEALREHQGREALAGDPFFVRLPDDADGLEFAEDIIGAGAAVDALIAARQVKEAAELEQHIAESERALLAYTEHHLGDQLAWLRARASTVEVDGSLAFKAAMVPPKRMPPLTSLSESDTRPQTPCYPFGLGPVRVSVRLSVPSYTLESHEIYERFNLALHRGRPRENSKRAFVRHLVSSPLKPAPASSIGSLYELGSGQHLNVRLLPDCCSSKLHDTAERWRLLALRTGVHSLAPSGMSTSYLTSLMDDHHVTWIVHMAHLHWCQPEEAIEEEGRFHQCTASQVRSSGAIPALPQLLDGLLHTAEQWAHLNALPLAAVIAAIFMLADKVYTSVSACPPPEVTAPLFLGVPARLTVGDIIQARNIEQWLMDLLASQGDALQWIDQALQLQLDDAASVVKEYGHGQPAEIIDSAAHNLMEYFTSVPDEDVNSGKIYVEPWTPQIGFGTFFQEYRIEEELVAVSVLDILPTRVASVYFFYNPDFRYLELGKLSALVEIWLTRQICEDTARNPAMLGLPPDKAALCRHWDANFYVHTCSAMNYKRHFVPSELLCPVLYDKHWTPITPDVLLKLDADIGAPLARVIIEKSDGSTAQSSDKDDVLIAAAERDFTSQLAAYDVIPQLLLGLSGNNVALYHRLSSRSKDLLERGLVRFIKAVRPDIALRAVLDPNWIASLESRQRSEQERRAATDTGAADASAP